MPLTSTFKAPKHLKPATRRWVEAIAAEWDLEAHHHRLLVMAGQAHDRYEAACDVINEHGPTYVDRFGAPRARPEVAIERDSRLAVARLLRELALDEAPPDSRPPRTGGRA